MIVFQNFAASLLSKMRRMQDNECDKRMHVRLHIELKLGIIRLLCVHSYARLTYGTFIEMICKTSLLNF